MGSTFNPQILVDKLSKLNSSQQSIETLSHWCIFHMNKAKQVVETWDRQFHSAPREQRLAFLYLANDILQNSRRKGAEFVAEFWKVLPDSLRDVIEHGDEFAKRSALRLISIWDERKVFGSRGQILKEEFVKKELDNGNKTRKLTGPKLQPVGGNSLEKLVSGFEAVSSSRVDEDAIFTKCRNAITFVEKVEKDVEGDSQLGHVKGGIGDELKEQHAVLRDCITQLAVVESARGNLVSLLREALQEQVYKLDQVRDQLQAAQTRSEQAGNICKQLLGGNGNGQIIVEQSRNAVPVSQMPQKLIPAAGEQTASVTYTLQAPAPGNSSHIKEEPKSAAAAMAAKLAASSSSAQMLTFMLSSLASEGVIRSSINEPPEKKAKLENEHPSYVPQNSPAPAFEQNLPVTSQEMNSNEPPPPPSSPPPMPPLPPPPMQSFPVPQYMQTAMPMLSCQYTYSPSLQPPLPPPGYTPAAPPATGVSPFTPPSNGYQNFPPEGGFYGQPSSLPMAPMSRQ
ncbi:regulation of nuclear pre-mRNA domain-containing protein 2-like isoform X1 [Salvia hispanica]|uniref:regulation of nuclear pre-mRNA domain-containing protein 2-like isoform X1 n=1 Tax=Salvia hispanica TaxID=49212 RepID=UPI002009DB77|nr:regulation of nuclear pre-mRNA domain-containing protein 2-like isoform X1 [Salvia hispanica]